MIVLKNKGDQELSVEYPRYYVEPDLTIQVNDYGQYVIHDLGYIEIAGNIELGEGSMLIVE